MAIQPRAPGEDWSWVFPKRVGEGTFVSKHRLRLIDCWGEKGVRCLLWGEPGWRNARGIFQLAASCADRFCADCFCADRRFCTHRFQRRPPFLHPSLSALTVSLPTGGFADGLEGFALRSSGAGPLGMAIQPRAPREDWSWVFPKRVGEGTLGPKRRVNLIDSWVKKAFAACCGVNLAGAMRGAFFSWPGPAPTVSALIVSAADGFQR